MLGGLCARMHAKKRPNGWLLSRGIKGSQRVLRRITGPNGSPSASLGCKYCCTRSCWLCKDILQLFRLLGPCSRAASISHPYPMQTFRYTKNDACHLRRPFFSSGIYPCGSTPRSKHAMGGLIKDSTAQCGRQCRCKGNDPLTEHHGPSAARGVPTETNLHVCGWAGRLCCFHEMSRMFMDAFDEVDWPQMHRALTKEVSRLFQVWVCTQVMSIAATNENLSWRHRNGRSNKCPCCTIHV